MSVHTYTYFVQSEDGSWYYYINDSNGEIEYDTRTATDQLKRTPSSSWWDVIDVSIKPFITLEEAEEHRRWSNANGFGSQINYYK